jgi:glycosyltransferase involved in cell wall biosynthesis
MSLARAMEAFCPLLKAHRSRLPPPCRAAVTVVIPCYNYGRYLRAATLSALRQDGVDVKVLIVDDASIDNSREVAKALETEFRDVSVVAHESNRGHIATYNDGLGRVDSRYVLLLSADDLLAPGALARAVSVMERHESVGLVYGFAPDFADQPPSVRTMVPHYSVWPGGLWLDAVCRRAQNSVCTPTAVMRLDLLRECGGYDPEAPHAGDFLLWLRAGSRRDVAYVSGVDQAFYRVHGENMHTTGYGAVLSDMTERRRALETFFESPDGRRPDPRRDQAMAALVAEAVVLARQARTGDPALRAFVAECGADPSVLDQTSSRRLAPVYQFRRDLSGRFGWRYWRLVGLRP